MRTPDGNLRSNPASDTPCVDDSAYIDATAILIGNVHVQAGTFVVFSTTLGDGVFIGSGAVVQNVRVPPNARIEPGRVVTSQSQADALSQTDAKDQDLMRAVIEANTRLTSGYSAMTCRRPK